MSHFKKHWDKKLQKKVLEDAEKIVSLIKSVFEHVTLVQLIFI